MNNTALKEEFLSLNPKTIKIKYDQFKDLQLEFDNGEKFSQIKVFRTFPFLEKNRYLLLKDNQGHEIGIIEDLYQLDKRSQETLQSALNKKYFIPIITKINKIEYQFRTAIWYVETKQGSMSFEIKGRSTAFYIKRNHLILKIVMVTNMKYQITKN